MIEVKEIPTEGQFVAVWIYNNKIWSSTYAYKDGILKEYSDSEDDFLVNGLPENNPEITDIKYFINPIGH